MQLRRILISSAISAAVLLAGMVPSAVAGQGPTYVAMGDSYSSGAGAGDYFGQGCARSANAYPVLWASAHPAASPFFAACAGATTATLMRTQLPALTPGTMLVSLTIGGNDIGFATMITACRTSDDTACDSAVSAAEAKATTELPAKLDHVFRAIRERSPYARIVVLNYPDLYQPSAGDGGSCGGISSRSQDRIVRANDVLSGVIARAAANRNNVVFADVRDDFASHGVCAADPWIWGWVPARPGDSFHPTAAGQRGGYLVAFTSALR